MLLARSMLLLVVLLPVVASAQRATTQEALSRLEETIAARTEDGVVSLRDLTPAIVVSVAPAFEETRAWYPAAALASLTRAFGTSALRSCEACMAPRLRVQDGNLEQNLAALGTAEIVQLDEANRGSGPPARTAIWLDETQDGVALRIIDLGNSRIVLAENLDPSLSGMTRTRRNFTMTRELERRARGDSLTHTFVDVSVYPGQHFSLDFTEQWGDDNHNLSGLSVSLFDPVLGIGGAYYRVLPRALGILVGAKVLLSIPTGLVSSITGQSTALIDPLVTAVFVARVPIATSNYGVVLTASTNGRVGVGISLMNISFLPVLP